MGCIMGIEQTKGHTADGSGLRGHSVGDVYPYIVFAKGTSDRIRWHVMKAGDSLDSPDFNPARGWPTAKQAYNWALVFKELDEMDACAPINHGDPLCYGV